MSQPVYQVRRAIVDDLPGLQALWESMHLPAAELVSRLKEFQVVVSEEGALLGALGMEINGRYGRIHSEAFADFAHAEILRDGLWERMKSLAANHGLARLWTGETAPFWKQNGFQVADANLMNKLPPVWAALQEDWLTLKLRDEEALAKSLDKEFETLKREAAEKTEKTLRMAKFWNFVATALAIILAAGVVIFCVTLLRHNPNALPH
jgi:N-acetylglutamate synthase-like GNAT family acetyltransferase